VIFSKKKTKICEERHRFSDFTVRSTGIGLTFKIPSSSTFLSVEGMLTDTKKQLLKIKQ